MKKILGLTALGSVLLLAACGGGGSSTLEETTCTFDSFGGPTAFILRSEDDTIVSATMTMSIDVSDWYDVEIENEIDLLTASEEDVHCGVTDNMLVCSTDLDEAELADAHFPLSLEEFISDMEANGATCE